MEPRKPLNIHFSIPAILRKVNWRKWLPSRGNVVFTLVVLLALFWAQSAQALPWAQPAASGVSTSTWPYQGRLANSSGQPITDPVNMVFRLYNSPATDAVALWTEHWDGSNSVLVSDGLFNVMLGSLTPIPQSVVTANGSLWLGITAGADNEMIPRVQLGSMPYAVQALSVPDSSIGTTKLADANVTTFKLADGAVTQAKLADGAVTQSKLGAGVSLIPPDGSITTAKLADDAVTGSKVADGSLQSRNVHLAIWQSTATQKITLSSSWQDVPGTLLTITADSDQNFLVITNADFEVNNCQGTVALIVDGIPQPTSIISYSRSDYRRGAFSQSYLISLNAGTHTLVLRSKLDNGSIGYVHAPNTGIIALAVAR